MKLDNLELKKGLQVEGRNKQKGLTGWGDVENSPKSTLIASITVRDAGKKK